MVTLRSALLLLIVKIRSWALPSMASSEAPGPTRIRSSRMGMAAGQRDGLRQPRLEDDGVGAGVVVGGDNPGAEAACGAVVFQVRHSERDGGRQAAVLQRLQAGAESAGSAHGASSSVSQDHQLLQLVSADIDGVAELPREGRPALVSGQVVRVV